MAAQAKKVLTGYHKEHICDEDFIALTSRLQRYAINGNLQAVLDQLQRCEEGRIQAFHRYGNYDYNHGAAIDLMQSLRELLTFDLSIQQGTRFTINYIETDESRLDHEGVNTVLFNNRSFSVMVDGTERRTTPIDFLKTKQRSFSIDNPYTYAKAPRKYVFPAWVRSDLVPDTHRARYDEEVRRHAVQVEEEIARATAALSTPALSAAASSFVPRLKSSAAVFVPSVPNMLRAPNTLRASVVARATSATKANSATSATSHHSPNTVNNLVSMHSNMFKPSTTVSRKNVAPKHVSPRHGTTKRVSPKHGAPKHGAPKPNTSRRVSAASAAPAQNTRRYKKNKP